MLGGVGEGEPFGVLDWLFDGGHMPSAGRYLDALAAGKIGSGDAAARSEHGGNLTLKYNISPASAGLGADFDHMIGGTDHRLVVLDDDNRVASVGQRADDAEESVDVARVQADGRLVEDEEGVDERGAEAGGEIDPLDLAAREGAGGAIEGEIAEAHLFEVAQAGDDGVLGEIALMHGSRILAE